MKLLICGDRNWNNKKRMKDIISNLNPQPSLIIQGGASGADSLAGIIAYELEIKCLIFPARWEVFGKAAGPIRNRQMIAEKPDLVFAFHSNIEKSKGTKDMINVARYHKIKVIIITDKE